MKLENASPFPARLFRGVVDERRMNGCVVARISHDIVDGHLRPAEVQRWPVCAGPWEGPQGPMPWGDRTWRRGFSGLVPGEPEPLREVPLTLARA